MLFIHNNDNSSVTSELEDGSGGVRIRSRINIHNLPFRAFKMENPWRRGSHDEMNRYGHEVYDVRS